MPNKVFAISDEAQSFISGKIKKLTSEGYAQDQAIVIAYSMAREKGFDVPEKRSSRSQKPGYPQKESAKVTTNALSRKLARVSDANLAEILKKHELWLQGDPSGVQADMSNADLSGADLSHADLSDANLSYANLSRANLSGTDLSGANLSGANLSGANLSAAYLSGANLSDADLSGANLSHANLTDTDLSAANLRDTDLSAANLPGADLSGANLLGADLSGANLFQADMSHADLSGANLLGTDLSAANLSRANLSAANLRDANLSAANLSAANLSAANLRDANLSGANLSDTDLSHANLRGARGYNNPSAEEAEEPVMATGRSRSRKIANERSAPRSAEEADTDVSTDEETQEAKDMLEEALADEFKATGDYDELAKALSDENAIALVKEIAQEEGGHFQELQDVSKAEGFDTQELVDEAMEEVDESAAESGAEKEGSRRKHASESDVIELIARPGVTLIIDKTPTFGGKVPPGTRIVVRSQGISEGPQDTRGYVRAEQISQDPANDIPDDIWQILYFTELARVGQARIFDPEREDITQQVLDVLDTDDGEDDGEDAGEPTAEKEGSRSKQATRSGKIHVGDEIVTVDTIVTTDGVEIPAGTRGSVVTSYVGSEKLGIEFEGYGIQYVHGKDVSTLENTSTEEFQEGDTVVINSPTSPFKGEIATILNPYYDREQATVVVEKDPERKTRMIKRKYLKQPTRPKRREKDQDNLTGGYGAMSDMYIVLQEVAKMLPAVYDGTAVDWDLVRDLAESASGAGESGEFIEYAKSLGEEKFVDALRQARDEFMGESRVGAKVQITQGMPVIVDDGDFESMKGKVLEVSDDVAVVRLSDYGEFDAEGNFVPAMGGESDVEIPVAFLRAAACPMQKSAAIQGILREGLADRKAFDQYFEKNAATVWNALCRERSGDIEYLKAAFARDGIRPESLLHSEGMVRFLKSSERHVQGVTLRETAEDLFQHEVAMQRVAINEMEPRELPDQVLQRSIADMEKRKEGGLSADEQVWLTQLQEEAKKRGVDLKGGVVKTYSRKQAADKPGKETSFFE